MPHTGQKFDPQQFHLVFSNMATNLNNQSIQAEKDADYLPISVKKAFLELQFTMSRGRIEEAINFAYGAFSGQVIDSARYDALRQDTLCSLHQRFEISDEQSNAILLLAAWRLDHEMRARDR
jgi:hypothetical protein